MATTNQEVWEAMTKEELIENIMHFDKESDDLSCENATYSDEANVRDRALSGIVSTLEAYHENFDNQPDDILLVELLDSLSNHLASCDVL